MQSFKSCYFRQLSLKVLVILHLGHALSGKAERAWSRQPYLASASKPPSHRGSLGILDGSSPTPVGTSRVASKQAARTHGWGLEEHLQKTVPAQHFYTGYGSGRLGPNTLMVEQAENLHLRLRRAKKRENFHPCKQSLAKYL